MRAASKSGYAHARKRRLAALAAAAIAVSYVVLIKTLAPTLDDAEAFKAPDPPHGLVGRQFSL